MASTSTSTSTKTFDLYYTSFSPPCSAVLLSIYIFGFKPEKKHLDLKKKEHMTPDFLKLNPQHTLPTLVDKDFVIWESRAILKYMIERYGREDHQYYPSDPAKRAIINQRLYMDYTLYMKFVDAYYPVMFPKNPGEFGGGGIVSEDKLKSIDQTFRALNRILAGTKYAAGDDYTIADIYLVVTVTTFESVNFDVRKYRWINKWLRLTVHQLPGYEEIHGPVLAEIKKIYLRSSGDLS